MKRPGVPNQLLRTLTLGLLLTLIAAACASESVVDETAAGDPVATLETAGDEAGADAPAPTEAPEPGAEPETEADEDPTPEPEPTEAPESEADADEPRYVLRGDLGLTVEEINGLIDFIEDETEREFMYPPTIVAQSVEEFEAGLAPDPEDIALFDEQVDTVGRTLQALGLTDMAVTEIRDTWLAAIQSSDTLAGYYDPETDELYVPVDAEPDADFQGLLVHELAHALDAQYIDFNALLEELDALAEAQEAEEVFVIRAIVEGRATAIQQRWHQDVGIPQSTDVDLGVAADVPPAMLLDLALPYQLGAQWIELNGGPANTWDSFENRPSTSEAILVGAADDAVEVPAPPAAGPVLLESEFGAAQLLVWMLGESLEPEPDLVFPTLAAVDGWDGGTSVLWGDDTESCVATRFAADDASDLDEIESVLALWADAGDGRTIINDGTYVDAVGCAPYVP